MPERSRPVLVVDDNPATRYATSRVLRAAGYETLEAATGGEAIDTVRAATVSAVVLDINLPDVNGFEVCRSIRAIPGAVLLPVVYLSATYVNTAARVYGLEAGADGYLTHPVEPAVLIATLRALLRTRAAEATAERTEARFKAVFEQALNGVALLSPDLAVLEANPAFGRLIGEAHGGLAGQPIAPWLSMTREDAAADIGAAIGGTATWRRVVPWRRADGSYAELDWQISTMGEPGALMASITDVTTAQLMARERERALLHESSARAEAERASRMKDEFLAVLSHELRTPLSAVLGWSQVLRQTTPDQERLANGLEVIERNARLQLRLISDLLDVSRIISGKLDLEFQEVDAAAMVRGAVDAERPAADARGIQLVVTVAPGTGVIWGDASRLQQVVTNLVGNAIKFTPTQGRVLVTLAPAGTDAVEIEVRDTGVGIDPAFLPHLFERFRQQDSTMRRSHGGLGLGLALVKHLVDLHRGEVRAASAGTGYGAVFTVRLPLARGDQAAARRRVAAPGRPEVPGVTPGALRGTRVLVVDDEADGRALLCDVLVEWGAEVIEAESAARARELVHRSPPDVLVSDIGMPVEDGYALLRSLRAEGLSPLQLPAIALTAFARGEDRQRALAAGYQAHLSKPVDLAVLIAQVAALAREARTPSS